MNKEFTLWLEFEEVDPGSWDIHNDFCNIHVKLPDGRQYGINTWTFEYFRTAIQEDETAGENLNGQYMVPPDLFVRELTRDCIEKTITDLLASGDLENILNPSVLP